MKLWLLRPLSKPVAEDCWHLIWDCIHGFVIREETEEAARQLAHEKGAEENSCHTLAKGTKINPWLSNRYTTCEELTSEGETGIVMIDFLTG